MNKWQILIWAGLFSYTLRAFPVLVMQRIRFSGDSQVFRFLNYSVYGVIGGIIYSSLFGARQYENLAGHFDADGLTKIAVVIAAVVISSKTKSLLITLSFCLTAYAIVFWGRT
ncbi:AzlD domain-containing protein [Caballeronia sp. LZ034LL]|uniref:AzlD domain-containing protein n=1 Tax=Caballeronia sp. LZ034LL TaxID=3038567 RepID=UPI0028656F81|nr:AzlD domain-containing protein [Caballeronia sp. LZ034LL]MDR5836656.1 AzlD domain-containing protein [Caballeronia sp. LZ034LL]